MGAYEAMISLSTRVAQPYISYLHHVSWRGQGECSKPLANLVGRRVKQDLVVTINQVCDPVVANA